MAPVRPVAKAPATAANAPLHATHVDLAEGVRREVVALLQARLYDAVDLTLQSKQAHWTVKGPHFVALHELFDATYDEVREHMDVLAERAASLGGHVDGTVQAAAAHSSLPPYPVATRDGMAHVAALARSLAAFVKALRRNIDEAAAAGDAVTADTFTQLASAVDKRLWLVEAHLQHG